MTYTWEQGTYTDGRPVENQWVCYDADGFVEGTVEKLQAWNTRYTPIAYQERENGKVHMTTGPQGVETVAEGQRLVEQWLTPEGHEAVHATHCRLV